VGVSFLDLDNHRTTTSGWLNFFPSDGVGVSAVLLFDSRADICKLQRCACVGRMWQWNDQCDARPVYCIFFYHLPGYVQKNIFKYRHELASGIRLFKTYISTFRPMPLTQTAQKKRDSESSCKAEKEATPTTARISHPPVGSCENQQGNQTRRKTAQSCEGRR